MKIFLMILLGIGQLIASAISAQMLYCGIEFSCTVPNYPIYFLLGLSLIGDLLIILRYFKGSHYIEKPLFITGWILALSAVWIPILLSVFLNGRLLSSII